MAKLKQSILYREWYCDLIIGKYKNGNNALFLDDYGTRHLVARASVNVEEKLEENEVAIKNYSENEGMLQVLTEAGVIEMPHRTIISGFVSIPICRLKVDPKDHPEHPPINHKIKKPTN